MSALKPSRLKIAQGNPGKRPLNRLEPPPLAERPAKPDWLSAYASEAWDDLVAILEGMGLLSRSDTAAIVALAVAVGDLRYAVGVLEREGYYADAENGRTFRHPALGTVSDATTRIKSLSSELGLTPGSRARLMVKAKPDEGDDLKAFLKKRHG